MAQAKIGYAAMLEQFGPQEVVGYSARGRGGRLRRRHGGRPLPAVGPPAGPGRVRLERADRDRRADHGRPRAGRHLPVVPDAPGDRRPGLRDPGGDVPRPALARARARARRSTSTSWAATGRRRPSGSPGCSRRSRSSASCSRARTSSTTARSSRWRRPGCGRCPTEPPPIYIATAGPITAKKTGAWPTA